VLFLSRIYIWKNFLDLYYR